MFGSSVIVPTEFKLSVPAELAVIFPPAFRFKLLAPETFPAPLIVKPLLVITPLLSIVTEELDNTCPVVSVYLAIAFVVDETGPVTFPVPPPPPDKLLIQLPEASIIAATPTFVNICAVVNPLYSG